MRTHENSTNSKIVVSGPIIEVFSYSFGLGYGTFVDTISAFEKLGSKKPTPEEMRRFRINNLRRNLIRLINANCWMYIKPNGKRCPPVMLTLTTAENITDLTLMNKRFTLFMKRFNYHVHKGDKTAVLKYVAVAEWQKRGAVHYHVALFNLPYVPQRWLQDMWGHGFVWVNRADQLKSLGRYLAKYLVKSFDDVRYQGHKRYMCSTRLYRPMVLYDGLKIKEIEKFLPKSNRLKMSDYYSQWLGRVSLDEYTLNNPDEMDEFHRSVSGILTTPLDTLDW